MISIVCLATANEGGVCYIETSSLDGETNLKTRTSLKETSDLVSDLNALSKFSATINCEHPNNSLYTFVGNITLPDKSKVSLDPTQLLLRGAKLCNTAWVYGVVVFSGRDTKVMRNLTQPPFKRSSLDRAVDRQVFIIFFIQFTVSAICAILSSVWTRNNLSKHWYLFRSDFNEGIMGNITAAIEDPTRVQKEDPINPNKDGAKSFATFIILFNTMVPISLIVTIEIVKVFQAFLIEMDPMMYHEETKTAAKARTSALNEELGQVIYIYIWGGAIIH